MNSLDTFQEYAQAALANFSQREAGRYSLVNAVSGREIRTVLDIGCGAGQELLPFLERSNAYCVGLDISEGLGEIRREIFGNRRNVAFLRSEGERLPFEGESFDLVLCRVALPYMHNRNAIAEVARVLKPGGVYLLKTHAPLFYYGMIRERFATLSPRLLAYPLLCLVGGLWHSASGNQLRTGFWKGKEVYQTEGFLAGEFERHGLRIDGYLPDHNPQTPSYLVVKSDHR